MSKKLLIMIFIPFLFIGCYIQFKTGLVKKKPNEIEMKLLNTAKILFDQGEYKSVRDLCSLFIISYPLSDNKEEVQFLLASALLKSGLYKEAQYEYETFLKNYPQTSRKNEIFQNIRILKKQEAIYSNATDIQETVVIKTKSDKLTEQNTLIAEQNKKPETSIPTKSEEKKTPQILPRTEPTQTPPKIEPTQIIQKTEQFQAPEKAAAQVDNINSKEEIIEKKPAIEPVQETQHLQMNEKWGPLRCAQILVLNAKNPDELEKEIDKLEKIHVNTIILRVYQNRGDRFHNLEKPKSQVGVYFATEKAPVVYDLLTPVIKICKSKKIKVFAWMTTRYCDWFLEEHADYREREYDFTSKKIIDSKGLNIFHHQVVNYLVSLYEDLAKYDIDGILFQDDLVLRHGQGFNEYALDEFDKIYGLKIDALEMFKNAYKQDEKYYVEKYSHLYDLWAKFKNRKILALAKKLMDTTRSINPDIKFALNLYYESVSDPQNALYWLSQDITASMECGFDYYSMMSYHDQISKELKLSREDAIYYIGKIASRLAGILGDPSKALLKIQTIDWDTGNVLPDWEIDEAFKAVTVTDGISLAFVPCRDDVSFDVISKYYSDEK
jgi:poly-beta-1,6-N-acetyl-D-glucosamine N-deacetylase